MTKKIVIAIICLGLIIAIVAGCFMIPSDSQEIKSISSEAELLSIYQGEWEDSVETENIAKYIVAMPFSFLTNLTYSRSVRKYVNSYPDIMVEDAAMGEKSIDLNINTSPTTYNGTTSKDYSTTNIQVENVDEADITKTDGDYIYSISGNSVIITNVLNPEEIKISSKITLSDGAVPEDLILYKDKLVVISSQNSTGTYRYNSNTDVKIYNITSRENPKLVKKFKLYQPYYTSRCINNELYIISSGTLRKDGNKILRKYDEDGQEFEIALNDIKYLKDVKTSKQTIISSCDLNNTSSKTNVTSYLMDVSNAYVSENAIYLLEQSYEYNYRSSNVPPISSLFGLKGAFGPFAYEEENDTGYSSGQYTKVYKFDISNSGEVKYATKTKVKGRTINQYSLDEKNGHLRMALYDYEGTRVTVLDENLNEIGTSSNLAKGENMYSSRFIGDKAYLVTYRTMDPLFVIDLSDETNPKALGKLHIPGYSTYLHPYDETHLIGIGMQTQENVYRDSNGKAISTTATITGMKMALFDVSDVNNPKQISETVIGDRRTTSAILTNPKALLFSKAKELIAIPVNNYQEDVEIKSEDEDYSKSINAYKNYGKPYIAEGYFVYNINLTDGFKLKGTITHEKPTRSGYYYTTSSKLLRGMYIEDNLYTVSERAVKVNKLDTLEQVSEIKIVD